MLWTDGASLSAGAAGPAPLVVFLPLAARELLIKTTRAYSGGLAETDLCVVGCVDGSVFLSLLPLPTMTRLVAPSPLLRALLPIGTFPDMLGENTQAGDLRTHTSGGSGAGSITAGLDGPALPVSDVNLLFDGGGGGDEIGSVTGVGGASFRVPIVVLDDSRCNIFR